MCTVGRRRLLLLCVAIGLVVGLATGFRLSRGSRVFRRYVCNPVPESVKNIRVHRPWELSGHRYVLRFDISKADMQLILNKRRYREVTDVEYDGGLLRWDLDAPRTDAENAGGELDPNRTVLRRESMSLYSTSAENPEPKWFRPADWAGAKGYRFKEMTVRYRAHIQIIVYNEQLGRAYCIEYQAGY